MIISNKHPEIKKNSEDTEYKEKNDPEYFREDVYGLRKVCAKKEQEQ